MGNRISPVLAGIGSDPIELRLIEEGWKHNHRLSPKTQLNDIEGGRLIQVSLEMMSSIGIQKLTGLRWSINWFTLFF
jgi:hypothetical protein